MTRHITTQGRIAGWLAVGALLAGCGAAAPPPDEPAGPVVAPEPAPDDDAPPEELPGPDARETRLEVTAEEMAARLEAGERVALHTVYFGSGSAELLPEGHPILAQAVVVLREHPDLRLRVEVHSDGQGSGVFNQRITNERALAIKEWLAAQGVDPARLEAAGMGENHPIAPNTTAEGREANRRVELVVPRTSGARGGALGPRPPVSGPGGSPTGPAPSPP